jgi:iron complex outermembrane receptor protein
VLPENVDAYEVGFKGQTSDGVMSIAAAAFLADYTNLQVQANRTDPISGAPTFIQTNAGSSQTKGFELEATFRPDDNFSLNAALTYAKTKVDVDGLSCPQQFTAAAPIIPVGGPRPVNACYRFQFINASTGAIATSGAQQDIRGGTLPASPEWRITVSPRYEHDLGSNFRSFIQTDLTYQSDQIFAIEQDPLLKQDGVPLVDMSVGVRQIYNRYSITFFVKNLFDQNFYTSLSSSALFPTNLTLLDLYANRPKNADRYIGGTIGFQF